ncbi:MAG: peptidylprolyl isomerase [Pseudomonadota bacterium]|nr:peptidylprolyl isomerase [Pseudomonadota bacterium]
MGISVNDIEITDEAVERELPHHASAPIPLKAAVEALVMREVLVQAARQKLAAEPGSQPLQEGVSMDGGAEARIEDALIDRLIELEVKTPVMTDEECETYYLKNIEQFRVGDLVEASHILFQVTPAVPLEILRAKAQEILQQVLAQPDLFPELARTYSNCTSAEVGGSLGQLLKGQTVPEFERVIFSLESGQIAPRLVESRFGLHIVRVERRVQGHVLPLEVIRDRLSEYLTEQVRVHALRQYLKILVGQANIKGIELDGAQTPLVQ